jgi:hypothetical protein
MRYEKRKKKKNKVGGSEEGDEVRIVNSQTSLSLGLTWQIYDPCS